MTAFDKHQVAVFRFVRCDFAADTGVAQLVYAFDDGPELIETVTIPGAPFVLDGARAEAVQQALRLLHLIAGVSYYKAGVPDQVRIDSYAIDAATAALVETVYLNGLGEFAYRNGLNLRGRFRLPVEGAPVAAPALGLREHALVAIGGGKDSLVSIEALRTLGIAETVTWIGGSQLIRACAERTGLPILNIGRTLAPELFELNRQGAWNGHIPVTAVNSMIMVLAALLQGVDQVVFSNERWPAMAARFRAPARSTTSGPRAGRSSRRSASMWKRTSPPISTITRCCGRCRSWRWHASSPRVISTTRTSPAATATSTSSANARSTAGAGCARSATSCSWRWRRSCPSRAW